MHCATIRIMNAQEAKLKNYKNTRLKLLKQKQKYGLVSAFVG